MRKKGGYVKWEGDKTQLGASMVQVIKTLPGLQHNNSK